MKFISWNVNGLRACMNKGFVDFFNEIDADIFAIQETKMQENQIDEKIKQIGKYQYFNSAVKKGYSGTAIFSKVEPLNVKYGIDEKVAEEIIKLKSKNEYTDTAKNVENELNIIAEKENKQSKNNSANKSKQEESNEKIGNNLIENEDKKLNKNKKINESANLNVNGEISLSELAKEYKKQSLLFSNDEGRLITLEFQNYYFVTCYVPNSKRGLERLLYRTFWDEEICYYLKMLNEKKPVVYCGDLNVAHKEIDLKNPKSNHHNAGFTDAEREKMTALLENGFIDTFRYKYPDKADEYSWWSYMFHSREKNAGWRIDYFIVSNDLEKNIVDSKIHQEILGSDHCPIELQINL